MEQLTFSFIDDIPPLCACGCGGRVKWGKQKGGWNKYIFNHHTAIQRPWRYDNSNAPLCACGCGKTVTRSKRTPYGWNKFIKGHKSKSPEVLLEMKKSPPLCACGCGKEVNWDSRNQCWRTFITGHYVALQWQNPIYRAKMVKMVRAPENREKTSAHSKVMWNNPGFRERISQIRQENDFSGRTSRRLKKAWKDPEYRSRMSEILKQKSQDPKYQRKRSELSKQLWQNPEYKNKCLTGIRKVLSGSPNNLESLFDFLTPSNIRYVGNRAWWRSITYRLPCGEYITGYKNPDFKVTGQPKIIELWGDYWHQGEFPEDIIDGWHNAGIECMVIWEHEWHESQELVLEKVDNFIERSCNE